VSRVVRVLVADRAPTRLGVRLALEGYAVICAEAEDVAAALSAARQRRPDVCLIGSSIPGDAIRATREICATVPETAVVILSDTSDVSDLLPALRAGAIGYVPAGFDAEQLRRVIEAVIADEPAVPRAMVKSLIAALREHEHAAQSKLTAREAEILMMLRHGHSTGAIASRLSIAPVTVRRHIAKLVHKAGARDRSELVGASVSQPAVSVSQPAASPAARPWS
jgi:DNA-binding NarL/FixJ family response regulator